MVMLKARSDAVSNWSHVAWRDTVIWKWSFFPFIKVQNNFSWQKVGITYLSKYSTSKRVIAVIHFDLFFVSLFSLSGFSTARMRHFFISTFVTIACAEFFRYTPSWEKKKNFEWKNLKMTVLDTKFLQCKVIALIVNIMKQIREGIISPLLYGTIEMMQTSVTVVTVTYTASPVIYGNKRLDFTDSWLLHG